MSNFAPDYIQVHERVAAFLERYPEGSLQSELVELTETRVVVKGFAYRTPDDPRPGTGYSSLGIPGTTAFTRGSEVENCETSAWGRAIAALGFEVKRGIATAEEVESKRPDAQERTATPRSTEQVTIAAIKPALAVVGPEVTDEDWAGLTEAPKPRPDPNGIPTCRHHMKPFKKNARGWYCPTKVGDGWCEETA